MAYKNIPAQNIFFTSCFFSASIMQGIEMQNAANKIGKYNNHCVLLFICTFVCNAMGMTMKLAVKIICNKNMPILSLKSSGCMQCFADCKKLLCEVIGVFGG